MLTSILSFETVFNIVKSKCANAEQSSAFLSAFAEHFTTTTEFLQCKVPEPRSYATALTQAIARSGLKLDPLAEELLNAILSKFKLRKPVEASKQARNPESSTSINLSSTKSKIHSSTVVLQKNTKSGVKPTLPVLKEKLQGERLAKIRNLSVSASDKVRNALSNFMVTHKRIYSSCKDNCDVCKKVFSVVPLTKCTHSKSCNEFDMFPHLSKSTLKALHTNPSVEMVCISKHWKNPLFGEDCPTNIQPMSIDQPVYSKEATTTRVAVRPDPSDPFGTKRLAIQSISYGLNLDPQVCPCGLTKKKTTRGNKTCPNQTCSYRAQEIAARVAASEKRQKLHAHTGTLEGDSSYM